MSYSRAERGQVAACAVSSDYGAMYLLTVKKLVNKYRKDSPVMCDILFEGNLLLPATPLHAFMVVRDGEKEALSARQLVPGNKVWIDVHAFVADGSFLFNNRTKAPEGSTEG